MFSPRKRHLRVTGFMGGMVANVNGFKTYSNQHLRLRLVIKANFLSSHILKQEGGKAICYMHGLNMSTSTL